MSAGYLAPKPNAEENDDFDDNVDDQDCEPDTQGLAADVDLAVVALEGLDGIDEHRNGRELFDSALFTADTDGGVVLGVVATEYSTDCAILADPNVMMINHHTLVGKGKLLARRELGFQLSFRKIGLVGVEPQDACDLIVVEAIDCRQTSGLVRELVCFGLQVDSLVCFPQVVGVILRQVIGRRHLRLLHACAFDEGCQAEDDRNNESEQQKNQGSAARRMVVALRMAAPAGLCVHKDPPLKVRAVTRFHRKQ